MRKILLLMILVLAASCEEIKVKPAVIEASSEENPPSQESWDSKVLFTERSRLKAILYSDHIRMYEEERYKLLDGVRIEFFDGDGNRTSVLTSKRGKTDDITQDMFAIDSVVVVSDSGTVVRTDELVWRNKDEKIVSDKFVSIVSPKEKMEGIGFESDAALKNYTIFNITYHSIMEDKKPK
ncbi:MAG: LPS export ABC transporter periplasmic protein LptC [Ignavibacteriales bacterium]|nr:LPS export ABC transporter periplasmic protein LptC [Ignavibacteriales bacterium]MCF8316783.1 LPS export ABC transporter periplasmic protein LptC [Ignavibacteriales bacterium]MCF8438087.1 LPS export ABC transporter periplasmic protein LptC [Ignavibacteriales bacterium]